jgi:hypothetical protein
MSVLLTCAHISKVVAEAKAEAEAFRQQLFAAQAKPEADEKVAQTQHLSMLHVNASVMCLYC